MRPLGVIDPLVPLHPSGKLRNGSYNFSWNTALYTRVIAYSLREFGQVKVMCSTIHVSAQVARSRIANAAYRLGVKVTTKVYRAYPETDYVIGTVIGSKKMEPKKCDDGGLTCCEDRENQRLDVATGKLDCVSCGADLGPISEDLSKALADDGQD